MKDENAIIKYVESITGKRDAVQIGGGTITDLPRHVTGLYDLCDVLLLGINWSPSLL